MMNDDEKIDDEDAQLGEIRNLFVHLVTRKLWEIFSVLVYLLKTFITII